MTDDGARAGVRRPGKARDVASFRARVYVHQIIDILARAPIARSR